MLIGKGIMSVLSHVGMTQACASMILGKQLTTLGRADEECRCWDPDRN